MAKYKFTVDDFIETLQDAKALVARANAVEQTLADLEAKKVTLSKSLTTLASDHASKVKTSQDEFALVMKKLALQRDQYEQQTKERYEKAFAEIRGMEQKTKQLETEHAQRIREYEAEIGDMQKEHAKLTAHLGQLKTGIQQAKEQAAKLAAV